MAFAELIAAVRRSQSATDRFDQAVADALRINRTDMRCLDVLQRVGAMTAGRLAEETGLSAGAMTTAIDRLERAGYARRVRDDGDRRRVLVELTPRVEQEVATFYDEHVATSARLFERYTPDEIELLLGFVREGCELNERRAAEVERGRRARAPTGSRRRASAPTDSGPPDPTDSGPPDPTDPTGS